MTTHQQCSVITINQSVSPMRILNSLETAFVHDCLTLFTRKDATPDTTDMTTYILCTMNAECAYLFETHHTKHHHANSEQTGRYASTLHEQTYRNNSFTNGFVGENKDRLKASYCRLHATTAL